jgi:predicted nucleic acid-binding protein
VPYLLDTNVLSELRKGARCDERVRAWATAARGERHCISVLSLGEIRKGIERLRRTDPERFAVFEQWLAKLSSDYDSDIIGITEKLNAVGLRLPRELERTLKDCLGSWLPVEKADPGMELKR